VIAPYELVIAPYQLVIGPFHVDNERSSSVELS
jgi:hypothetical protein